MVATHVAEVRRFVPRYVPDRPLPPYAFEPGHHPHPTRDPEGHSRDRGPEPPETAFEWGVDLYNHGYFWEAHEAWEASWRSVERDDPQAELLQGLIQCAAACLKLRGGDPEAARRLGGRATAHLDEAIDGGAATRGIDLCGFTARFTEWLEEEPVAVEERPPLVISRHEGAGSDLTGR